MRVVSTVLVVGLCLGAALPAAAQNIGILQSAETIDRGVFKLQAAPMMVFGKEGADDQFGIGARLGYGFADRFDASAKLGLFEDGTYVGADGEFWLLGERGLGTGPDLSLTGGLHWIFGSDGAFDTMGLEIAPQVSGHLSPKLELCGTLVLSFERIDDAPEGVDDTLTRLHLVPGIEYRIAHDVDLVGEFGLGLNDDSFSYLGAGVAFYFGGPEERPAP